MNKDILGTILRSSFGATLIYAIYYILNSDGSTFWHIVSAIAIFLLGAFYIFEFVMLILAGPIFYLTKHK